MSAPPDMPIQRVDDAERRRLFNDVERIQEKVISGELIIVTLPETYRNIKSPDEPAGTVGKMLSYRDPANNNQEVCRAYAYIRPDGTLGGSGRMLPDPKIIISNGVKYLELTRKQREEVAEQQAQNN